MTRPLRVLLSSWGVALFYVLFVILFGALVRITGSGAGCGQHWPTCHGEIAHIPESLETLIELTHRVTSGLSLVLVFGLAVLTWRRHAAGHPARRAAFWSCVFMITESLVGAALVLLAWVGNNDSLGRAVIMAVHLVNTSLLTFAILWAVWTWKWEPAGRFVWRGAHMTQAWIGTLLLLIISAAGAVTALGDTLYPLADATPVLSTAAELTDSSSHFLERLRSFHPVVAITGALFLGKAVWSVGVTRLVRLAFSSFLGLQIGAGLLNVALSAPGWLQIVHLGIANLLWLSWVWLVFESAVNSEGAGSPRTEAQAALL